jgi:hypothetical protein
MSNGPNIKRDGLVFYYDVNNSKSYIGKPATNFYTNGDFTNGSGITQEAGSNPTNQIVIYPNPGNSQYVLRQTGNYTEYQINLTSQLSSSTTYVLSGWYAESNDYDGTSTMFHCRAFSSSGNHVALDNGIGTIIKTVNVGGLNWKYCYVTITTPSDYNGDFNWYLGYGQPSCNGYRYYTNIQMELGSYPSTFVDGTRSSTQGLLDLTRNTTIDLSNISFESNDQIIFDGTNDYIDTNFSTQTISNVTIEAVFYDTKGSGYRAIVQNNLASDDALYINPSNQLMFWPCSTSSFTISTNTWYYAAVTYNGSKLTYFLNGVFQEITTTCEDITDWDFLRIGAHGTGDGERFIGKIPMVKLYNVALTNNEISQNYNALKNRFGI